MESLEGKRGLPRLKPPFPAIKGLYGGPTVINNVETIATVPPIILNGGKWYASFGPNEKNGGTRLTCLTGHFNKPGVYELPLGYPAKKMIYEVGGGIPNGRELKAFVPGGSSTFLLTREEAESATMDYDWFAKRGEFLGSGGVVAIGMTS